jgi:[acyl-carrier-protein] S-malonyltransferase
MDCAGGPDGLLGYVRGLSEAAVQGLCDRHRCHIAIRNPDRLFVVGGDKGDVLAVCIEAEAQGAMRAAAMNVHIASHTPLLESAVASFRTALLSVEPESPRLRLMSTERQSLVSSPARAIPDLAAQMAKPIDWATTLIALQERGVSRILELGPGSALSDMANGTSPDWKARSFDDFETASGASHWFKIS